MSFETRTLPEESLTCTADEAHQLIRILEACPDGPGGEPHGMKVEVYDPDTWESCEDELDERRPFSKVKIVPAHADNSAAWYELPISFRVKLGDIISQNGKDHLMFGYAHTSYNPKLGELGGGRYMITSKGELVEFEECDPRRIVEIDKMLDDLISKADKSTAAQLIEIKSKLNQIKP